VTLASPLFCIDHFNPYYPQTPSTIEWLFPWTANGTISPSQVQATLQVTPPGQAPMNVMSTLGSSSLYFLFGIYTTGTYGWQVTSMRDTMTNQLLNIGGTKSGTVNVTFPGELNPGQCAPPPP